jgi:two-component system, chemotaxis family, CheB/CheR fusion protein
VRELVTQLTMSEQEERRRISAILHDDLQQRLFSLSFQMLTLQGMLSEGQLEDAKQYMGEIQADLRSSIDVTRNLSVDLSPPVLHNEGILEAIHWLAAQMEQQHGLRVEVSATNRWPRLNEDLRVLLFQLVRELLFNIIKHADVANAAVTFVLEDNHLKIQVSDQGRGFDINASHSPTSQGLARIQQRLGLIGGHMQVESVVGEGTVVTLYIPIIQQP